MSNQGPEPPVLYSSAVEGVSLYPAAPEDKTADEQLYIAFSEGIKEGSAKPRIVDALTKESINTNWFALLFGPFYFAYRKCGEAVGVILLAVAILGFVDIFLRYALPSFTIAFGIAYALGFYPFYRWKAKKTIKEAMQEKNSEEDRLLWIRMRGGTSIGMVFASILGYLFILGFLLWVEVAFY